MSPELYHADAACGLSDNSVQMVVGGSCSDLQHGAREGDLRPRYPSEVCEGCLQPVAMDHPTQGYKALKDMRTAQPCLMQQSPLVSRLANRWTPKHLVSFSSICCSVQAHLEICGPVLVLTALCSSPLQESIVRGTEASLQVLCSASGKSRFIECSADRNVFGAHYHVREPETQHLYMSLQDFMQCAQSWQIRQLCLKVCSSMICQVINA